MRTRVRYTALRAVGALKYAERAERARVCGATHTTRAGSFGWFRAELANIAARVTCLVRARTHWEV